MKWLLGTFVSFVLDMLVFEALLMLISKSEDGGVKECCKRRGVYFDFDIYSKFYYKKLR